MSVALSGTVVDLRFTVEQSTAKGRGTAITAQRSSLCCLLRQTTNRTTNKQPIRPHSHLTVERHTSRGRRCVEPVLRLFAIRQWRVIRLPCELNGAGAWAGCSRLKCYNRVG